MTAGSANAARDALLDTLRASASCITSQVLLAARQPAPRLPVISFVPIDQPISLRVGARHDVLLLSVSIEHTIVEVVRRSFEAAVTGYICRILDRKGNEIITYHWHPTGASRVMHPHLHVPSAASVTPGAQTRPLSVAHAHLTTGYVRFRDIVRMLIEEFSVQPLREDWQAVLGPPDTQVLPE
jgi:hypothetical protein